MFGNTHPSTSNTFQRSLSGVVLALSILVAAAVPASAANLLSNGEFPNDTFPWIVSKGTAIWSNLDHAGSTATGSARISDTNNWISNALAISECVNIQGNAAANVSGFFKASTQNPSGSWFTIGFFYYSDSNCLDGTFVVALKSATMAPPANWVSVSLPSTTPSNARGAKMIVEVKSGADSSVMDLYADGLVLSSTADVVPKAIFLNGFESGNLSDWIVVN